MDTTTWLVILGVLTASVGGAYIYYRRRAKDVQQLFEQVSESAKQIPQQKRPSFILFMFKESVRASKAKKGTPPRSNSDPKQLEAQLVQMTFILKDRSKVTDKNMKRALQTYDSYKEWEKKRTSKTAKTA